MRILPLLKKALLAISRPGARNRLASICCLVGLLPVGASPGEKVKEPLKLERSNYFEILRGDLSDTVLSFGAVRFTQEDGVVDCDSAVWVQGEYVAFWGSVRLRDAERTVAADSIHYNLRDSLIYAVGDSVVITSLSDSVRARSRAALFYRGRRTVELTGRPRVQLGYPDEKNLRIIIADFIRYDFDHKNGVAQTNVEMLDEHSTASATSAAFSSDGRVIRLYDNVKVRLDDAIVSGDFVRLVTDGSQPQEAFVYEGAQAEFYENTSGNDSLKGTDSTRSVLRATSMRFAFSDGDIREVRAIGQAYSEYYPATEDSTESIANIASGDSIILDINHDTLKAVFVHGGAVGSYIHAQEVSSDSVGAAPRTDTDSVRYHSEHIAYLLADSIIHLSGGATVEDSSMNLRADSIVYQTGRRFMKAFADSVNQQGENAIAKLGVVTLRDGSQTVRGKYLEYSMESDRGYLVQSQTQYQSAYYGGDEFFRESADVYYASGGEYTSCSSAEPHFHFWSSKMKMINDDKVIARPVVLYIEKIPVLVAPYYVFPLKKGRRSGLLNFRFGGFAPGGRYLANVGYFWAASERWDIEGSGDYYEESGIKLNGRLRYASRYKFTGALSGSYAWDAILDANGREIKSRRWNLSYTHSHTFNPTMRMSASGLFVSDSRFYNDFSNNLSDRLNRNIRSVFSLEKSFPVGALSVQATHVKSLDGGSRQAILPAASFSYRGLRIKGIHTGYGVSFRNISNAANAGLPVTRQLTAYSTMTHNTNARGSFNLLRYITVSPSVPYSEHWFMAWPSQYATDRGAISEKFFRTYSYSSSIGIGTKLYGLFSPNILGLKGIRHEIEPTVAATYTPFIHFDSSTVATGRFVGAPVGSKMSRFLSFALRNSIGVKIGEGTKERKYQIVSMNTSLSYNPGATSRRWSEMNTSLQTSILGKVTVTGNLTHTFYENGGLQSFSISSSYGTRGAFGKFTRSAVQDSSATQPDSARESGLDGGLAGGIPGGLRSWSLQLRHYFTESGRDETFAKTHFLSFSGSLQITPSLSLGYSQYFDIARDITVNRRLEIRRILHCWEGEFSWVPNGSNSGYYFRINVISIPDIKYESTTSGIRGRF